jgi:nucleoside-diphosphate-sugar epimerase
MGEELCRLYAKKGLDVRIIRLPIVFGPKDNPNKLVSKLIADIKSGKAPKITTKRKLDFLYVNDAARVIEKEAGLVLNVSGRKHTLYSLSAEIRRCLKEVR